MITAFAKRWLSRRGFYVAAPDAVEMVLSGYWTARQDDNGDYHVCPPYPDARVCLRNNSHVTLNGRSRSDEYNSLVANSPGGRGLTLTENGFVPLEPKNLR